ncbi:Plant disease resistance response protein [Cynara cardunculus var. scolymus]|uniref:Dirigent protein n=1 Tax=Cynara cardunculus var. scolymus TaxID=59895 RepID=A0A103XE02_CYNCS|nr:Plant disease resistance response protein [Cynara cardunculus var. scolymus]
MAQTLPILTILLLSLLLQTQSHKFSSKLSPKSFGFKKEKLSHLHFYFHDIVGGDHPTAVRVAAAATTNTSQTGFGATVMIDDPLTVGPERTSKIVGRAQGIYASACLTETRLLMALNYVFVEGKYNGSTLSILGTNSVMSPVREMPIVGGSGLFRFARGYALAKTVFFNISNGKYNGSSLSILGRNAVLDPMREMTVVGGSGLFLFAKGYAQAKTHSLDLETGNAVVEYNVVAEATVTNTSASLFGAVVMIDDPLTVGPERTSRIVGRAQGLYASADLDEFGLTMVLNYVFIEGKYNGSTLSILGRNKVMSSVREMPIIGGTGLFRFARGYALAKTYSLNFSNGDAVVEYNVYVIHY